MSDLNLLHVRSLMDLPEFEYDAFLQHSQNRFVENVLSQAQAGVTLGIV